MCNICFSKNLGAGMHGKWKCLKCLDCGQLIVVYKKDDLNRNWHKDVYKEKT